MKKAYLDLIKYALNNKALISVWDGEEWQVKMSTSYKEVKDAVESVEMAWMKLRQWPDGNSNLPSEVIGSVTVIPHDVEPEETVADFSVTPFLTEWDRQYSGETA